MSRPDQPVRRFAPLAHCQREICESRGYCGPFANRHVYAAVPGWEGIADCLTCGNTVHTRVHEARRFAGAS